MPAPRAGGSAHEARAPAKARGTLGAAAANQQNAFTAGNPAAIPPGTPQPISLGLANTGEERKDGTGTNDPLFNYHPLAADLSSMYLITSSQSPGTFFPSFLGLSQEMLAPC